MIIPFNKYQCAGNDFIIIDNRSGFFNSENSGLINKLCDRRFGIGADGLMLISGSRQFDYVMKYFNSDGLEGSMCGNGGRCSADFAIRSGIAGNRLSFKAADGIHYASSSDNIIRLSMNDAKEPQIINGNYFIHTGSPNYVIIRKNIDGIDINDEGRKIRWAEEFAPVGTNVNFVEIMGDGIYVRTFEKGVEQETLSCGTGAIASAIVSVLAGHFDINIIPVKTTGGDLSVSFRVSGKDISDIWLSGPVTFVFRGEIEV